MFGPENSILSTNHMQTENWNQSFWISVLEVFHTSVISWTDCFCFFLHAIIVMHSTRCFAADVEFQVHLRHGVFWTVCFSFLSGLWHMLGRVAQLCQRRTCLLVRCAWPKPSMTNTERTSAEKNLILDSAIFVRWNLTHPLLLHIKHKIQTNRREVQQNRVIH